jgi:hypothetical protein
MLSVKTARHGGLDPPSPAKTSFLPHHKQNNISSIYVAIYKRQPHYLINLLKIRE